VSASKKLFRLTIKPDHLHSKVYTLHADDVDMSMTPWVVIRGIQLAVKSSVLHIFNEDYERFKDVKTLTIPYTALNTCEELHEAQAKEYLASLHGLRQV